MKFVNRNSQEAGRIKLIKSDGTVEICKIELFDDANANGTPLNAQTFEDFREDVLNTVESFNGVKKALAYGQTIRVTTENFVNTALNFAISDFNRTPIVHETFLGAFYFDVGSAAQEQTYLCVCKITAVDEANGTCRAEAIGRPVKTSGVGIAGVSYVGQSNDGGNIYKMTFTNDQSFNFVAPRGANGSKGDTGAKGDKGDRGEKGESGSGVYLSGESFSTGVGRYDVSSVAYNKPELCAGDLILSTSSRNLVRVRSLTSDGFIFIGEYVLSL